MENLENDLIAIMKMFEAEAQMCADTLAGNSQALALLRAGAMIRKTLRKHGHSCPDFVTYISASEACKAASGDL